LMFPDSASLYLVLLAFFLETADASFGGGYGTILTPLLLLMGLESTSVVPAVLVSQLAGDFLASFFHHEFRNVDLSTGGQAFKAALALAVLGSAGCIVSVIVAVNLPKLYLNLYIGMLAAAIGFLMLAVRNGKWGFSWRRLAFVGSIAAFNKGISGGGYGPVITGGQILTGVEPKSAIGVTSLSEGVTCIVAVLSYLVAGRSIDWSLAMLLAIGVSLSTPVSAYLVRKMRSGTLKLTTALLTLALGLLTILKAF